MLALGLNEGWLVVGIRHFRQLAQLPDYRAHPVRAAILSKRNFRDLRLAKFGQCLRQERVHVLIREIPDLVSAEELTKRSAGYCLSFTNFGFALLHLEISVDPQHMQLRIDQQTWRLSLDETTWLSLERECLRALSSQEPEHAVCELRPQRWILSHSTAGCRELHSPYQGLFLRFSLQNLRMAGLSFRTIRTPVWVPQVQVLAANLREQNRA